MKVMSEVGGHVAVYVHDVRVNPENAHCSINQRHRELFTGALSFGHLYRNKSILWLK